MDILVIQFVDIMWFGKLISESDDVLVIEEPIEAILDRRSGKLALGSIPFVTYSSDELVKKTLISVNKKSITVRTWWIGSDDLDKVYDVKIQQVRASRVGIELPKPNLKL